MNYDFEKVRKITVSLKYNYDTESYEYADIYLFYEEGMKPRVVSYSSNKEQFNQFLQEYFKQKGIDPTLPNVIDIAMEKGILDRVEIDDEKAMAELKAEIVKAEATAVPELNNQPFKEETVQERINRVTGITRDDVDLKKREEDLTEAFSSLTDRDIIATPRERGAYETDDEYIKYLEDFYKSDEFINSVRAINPEYASEETVKQEETSSNVPPKVTVGKVERPMDNITSNVRIENSKQETSSNVPPKVTVGKVERPMDNITSNVQTENSKQETSSNVPPKVTVGKVEKPMENITSNVQTENDKNKVPNLHIVPPIGETQEDSKQEEFSNVPPKVTVGKTEKVNPKIKVVSPAAHKLNSDIPPVQSDLTEDEEKNLEDAIKDGIEEDAPVKPKKVRFGKVKKWAKRIGLTALAIIVGSSAVQVIKNFLNKDKGTSEPLKEPVVQQQVNLNQMNNQSQYVDYSNMTVSEFQSQLTGTQSQAFARAYNFLINASENTDQMSFEEFSAKIQNGEAINFRLLEDQDNTLNFTVDEVMATIAVLNNYGPEELAQLYHGTTLNSETIMNDYENFYKKASVYYMNATKPLGITQYLVDANNTKEIEFWNRLETSLINCNKEIRDTGTLSTKTSDQFIRDAYYSYMYENAYANDDDIDPAMSYLASAMIEGYTLTNRNCPENLYLHETLDSDKAIVGGIEVGTKIQQIREDEKNDIAGIENLGISNELGILDAVNDGAYCNKVGDRLKENVIKAETVNSEIGKATLISALAANGRIDAIQYINQYGVTESLLSSLQADPILASSVEEYRENDLASNSINYEELRNFLNNHANVNSQISDLMELVEHRTRNRQLVYVPGTTTSRTSTTTTTTREEVDYDSLTGDEKRQADEGREQIERELAEQNREATEKKQMNEMEQTVGPTIVDAVGQNDTVHTETDAEGNKTVVATDAVSGQDFTITDDAADALFQAQVNGDQETADKLKDALVDAATSSGIDEDTAQQRADELAQATQQYVQQEQQQRQEAMDAIEQKEQQSIKEAAERDAAAEAEVDNLNDLVAQSIAMEAASNGEQNQYIPENQGNSGSTDGTVEDDQTKENFGEEEIVIPEEVATVSANQNATVVATEGVVEPTHDPAIVEQAINDVVAEMTENYVDPYAEEGMTR